MPAANETSSAKGAAPVLAASVLGPFRALLNDQVIGDWPNCRGKAIFKYLLLNRRQPVAREALIERFWPEAEPEAARNNLNVAIHRLRRALGRDGFPFVLFSDGRYLLNPKLVVSIDTDAFLAHATRATELEQDLDLVGAIREYTAGVALYQGELLAEDRHGYDEWLLPLRQQLRDRYLHVLDRLGRIHFERQDVPSLHDRVREDARRGCVQRGCAPHADALLRAPGAAAARPAAVPDLHPSTEPRAGHPG